MNIAIEKTPLKWKLHASNERTKNEYTRCPNVAECGINVSAENRTELMVKALEFVDALEVMAKELREGLENF